MVYCNMLGVLDTVHPPTVYNHNHLKTETGPVAETIYYSKNKMMSNFQSINKAYCKLCRSAASSKNEMFS
jgi:hypothetical protein